MYLGIDLGSSERKRATFARKPPGVPSEAALLEPAATLNPSQRDRAQYPILYQQYSP